MAEPDDRPVMPRTTPARRFPAIAHIDAAARPQHLVRHAIMGIGPGERFRAIVDIGKIDLLRGTDLAPVEMRRAIDTQARNAAIGIDVQLEMRPDLVGRRTGSLEEMMGGGTDTRTERRLRDDLRPDRRRVRIASLHKSSLYAAMGRKIAGKMAGIDIKTMDDARHGEPDNAVIMTRHALAPAFPAVHPLAIVVIDVGQELCRFVLQHAVERREEIIRRIKPGGAEARGSEIDRTDGKIGQVGGRCVRHCLLLEAWIAGAGGRSFQPAHRLFRIPDRRCCRSVRSKAARISSFVSPLTAMMKGKPNFST